MTYQEFYKNINKPWANVTDIQKITMCGRSKAYEIFRTISSQIEKENKKLPQTKEKIIPMDYLLKYLNIDINTVIKMANY